MVRCVPPHPLSTRGRARLKQGPRAQPKQIVRTSPTTGHVLLVDGRDRGMVTPRPGNACVRQKGVGCWPVDLTRLHHDDENILDMATVTVQKSVNTRAWRYHLTSTHDCSTANNFTAMQRVRRYVVLIKS